MKFFISNNTTYNYSYYATRPKWLIEPLLKASLSQNEFEANSSYSKKSAPIHKIAFAPWPQKLKNQGDKGKEQNTALSHFKTKDSPAITILQTQTKHQTIASQRLKPKKLAAGSKIIKTSSKKRRLFQTKELLCWTSDLSFFNLRGYFSNILKVLQICRFAVRNNKKILFVKSSNSSYGEGKELSPWLVQYKRNTIPTKLSNLFNKPYLKLTQPLISPQILYLKKNKENNQGKNDLHKIVNIPKNSLLQQEEPKGEPMPHILVKNSPKANLLEKHSNRLKEVNISENKQSDSTLYYRRYYQLNSVLNDCLNFNFGENYSDKNSYFKNHFLSSSYFKNQKMISNPWGFTFCLKEPFPPRSYSAEGVRTKIKSRQKKMLLLVDLYLKSVNDISQEQSLKNKNQYKRIVKKVTVRVDNVIKLWIKEAQTISQQTAAGLTIPLAGFLTNSKTTFNTIYNLLNEDAYSSVSSNLKLNRLLNKGTRKINTNRLEKIHFKKSCHLSSLVLPKHLQDDSQLLGGQSLSLALPFITTRIKKDNDTRKTKNSVKTLRYRISQKQIGKRQENDLGTLAFSFPKVFESWKLTTTKGVRNCQKKQFIQYKDSNIDITSTLQKAWWTRYSNRHNYLALTPNTRGIFKDNEFITCNEKIKNPRPLECCVFGDVFTWQSKSQKSSSMFYFNSPFSKNKENVIFDLKKQVILEKRGPIIFKRKKPPFFTHFKKQLQEFKNLKLQLKEALNCLTDNSWQRQKKCSFLRKKQFLSTLAKYIVFYFNDDGIKNRTKQTKKNRTYTNLPSFSNIKGTVKLHLHSRNYRKYGYKPIYGYNIAFHALERILNQQDTKKESRPLLPEVKTKGNKARKRLFFRTLAQGHQKNKKWPQSQKKRRLRSLLFYKYYKTIITLNHFNQYKMFAKTPFVNNGLADIIFFINPEKNQNLVTQANSLKIPTVGITSGNMVSAQGHQSIDNFRLKDSVYYPILGNPISSVFTRAIIRLIVKCLRVEKSKNKWS